MEKQNKFDEDFNEWLYEKYGAKDFYELFITFKHKYLSEFLEFDKVESYPPAIGEIAHKYKMDRIRKETKAMEKYYNENPEKIEEFKS